MKKANSKKITKKIAKILSSENLIDNSQKRCFRKKSCNSNCDNCNCCNCCSGCNGCNYDNCNNCNCDYCETCNKCEDSSICEIIKSIALVETAISHILNAEGEKIQKAVEISNSVCELLEVNDSVRNTIRDITELECMLSRKLEIAISTTTERRNCNGCSIR